jgi:hypothetical protein
MQGASEVRLQATAALAHFYKRGENTIVMICGDDG